MNENEKKTDVENYLREKELEEFLENLSFDCENEGDEVFFEDQDYSYSDSSDSESDSGRDENDLDLNEELKSFGKEMNRDTLSRLLKILRNAGHKELPNSAEKLLDIPKFTIITRCEEGEYFHYGLIKCLEDLVERGIILPATIKMDIRINGVPLSKSTNRKMWPIVARIRNLPRLSPFLIGAYHGQHNPTSSKPFLEPFVDDYKKLEKKEILIGSSKHKIQLRNVICDTPGQCMVTNTKGYDGYEGCGRCIAHGNWRKKSCF